MDDVVAAIQFIARQPVDQPWRVFNLTAPQDTTQQEFAQTAARLLHRKLWLSLPAGLMRAVMGEQADLVLDGQHVEPARLLAEGYSFHYPTLDAGPGKPAQRLTGRLRGTQLGSRTDGNT